MSPPVYNDEPSDAVEVTAKGDSTEKNERDTKSAPLPMPISLHTSTPTLDVLRVEVDICLVHCTACILFEGCGMTTSSILRVSAASIWRATA